MFQLMLNKVKCFFDFSILLTFCHLLNRLRQFGQNNPIANPDKMRHKIKNHASGYNI